MRIRRHPFGRNSRQEYRRRPGRVRYLPGLVDQFPVRNERTAWPGPPRLSRAFPSLIRSTTSPFGKKGQYACSLEEVSRNVQAASRPRIKLIEGFFEKSLRSPQALEPRNSPMCASMVTSICRHSIACGIWVLAWLPAPSWSSTTGHMRAALASSGPSKSGCQRCRRSNPNFSFMGPSAISIPGPTARNSFTWGAAPASGSDRYSRANLAGPGMRFPILRTSRYPPRLRGG